MADNATHDVERMTVTRIFNAPRELVWKAWTQSEYVAKWWGPQGFTAPVVRMDVRVGGKSLLCMKTPDGQEFWNGIEYLEVIPYEKIVSLMYFADAQGNRVDSDSVGIEHEAIADAHDVTLFEDLGDGRTKLTQIGNESMASARESGQLEGWNQILVKLDDVVAELASAK